MWRFRDMKPGLAVVALALLGAAPADAAVSSSPDETFVTDGVVHAVARSADTIYLGGDFERVGPRTGPWVALSASSGEVDAAMPEVSGGEGTVNAIVGDGSGGFFVGGDFTHVGGVPRNNLAHVLADKSVDPGWDPDVSDDVIGMALSAGILYFGGQFDGANSVGSSTRDHGAAVNATTGAVTAWNPDTSGPIRTLLVSGSTVYIGGAFGTVNNGAPPSFLAAVNATTGTSTGWDPGVSGGAVNALELSGSTLYIAGGFIDVNNGTTRNHLAAVDTTTGTATSWDPDVNNPVDAMVLSGSTVYFGGSFNDVNNGTTRNGAAAVDASSGAATSWDPAPGGGGVDALAVSGPTVYLGGSFRTVNFGTQRTRLAAVDATDGTVTSWNPHAGDRVTALAVSGSTVLAGGEFASVGGKRRNNVAALDAADGSLTPWNPDADGQVNALAISGSTVYLGGSFIDVNDGTSRVRLAAVDATDGTATSWNPSSTGTIDVLAVSGSTVYVGGSFDGPTSINGSVPRSGLAALDATTGAATSWDPQVNGTVEDMAVSGPNVYIGGDFEGANSVGSQTRNYAAAVDATTGTATGWDPDPDSYVYALEVSGPTVYLGGEFETINGSEDRNYAAAVDATTGTATNWDPDLDDYVYALAASGSTVYIGGDFEGPNAINGSLPRDNLAAVDATTGVATGWAPDAQAAVHALTPDGGGGVIAGGEFRTLELGAQRGIAAFSEAPAEHGRAGGLGYPGGRPDAGVPDGLLGRHDAAGLRLPVAARRRGHRRRHHGRVHGRGRGRAARPELPSGREQLRWQRERDQRAGGRPGSDPRWRPGARDHPARRHQPAAPGANPAPGGPRTTRPPSLRRTGKGSARRRGSTIVVNTGLTGICHAGGAACSFRVTGSAVVSSSLTALAARSLRITLGRARVVVATGSSRRLTFKLNARAVRVLRELKRVRVRLRIVMRAGDGAAVTATRAVTIRAR